jgi:hypothetical protein
MKTRIDFFSPHGGRRDLFQNLRHTIGRQTPRIKIFPVCLGALTAGEFGDRGIRPHIAV